MAKRSRADVKYAIDLLWGHQIRRENTILHKQLQQLQTRIDHLPSDHDQHLNAIETAQRTANQASSAVDALAEKLSKTDNNCNLIATDAQATSRRIDAVAEDILTAATEHQATSESILKRIEAAEASIIREKDKFTASATNAAADLQQILKRVDNKADRAVIDALVARLDVLEDHVAGYTASRKSEGRPGENVCHNLPQHARGALNAVTGDNTAIGVGDEEEEEYMLTQRDIEPDVRSTSLEESIDLDQNATMASYARNARRLSHVTESLQPITFAPIDRSPDRPTLDGLRQGQYDSWERYLADAQDLLERCPLELEITILHKFVDGLYASAERKRFEEWLDQKGWSWQHVSEYCPMPTPVVSQYSERTGEQQETVTNGNKGKVDTQAQAGLQTKGMAQKPPPGNAATTRAPLAQCSLREEHQPRAVNVPRHTTNEIAGNIPTKAYAVELACNNDESRPVHSGREALEIGQKLREPPNQASATVHSTLKNTNAKKSMMSSRSEQAGPRRSQRIAALHADSTKGGHGSPPQMAKGSRTSATVNAKAAGDLPSAVTKIARQRKVILKVPTLQQSSIFAGQGERVPCAQSEVPPSHQPEPQNPFSSAAASGEPCSGSSRGPVPRRSPRLTQSSQASALPLTRAMSISKKPSEVEKARSSIPRTVQETSPVPSTPSPKPVVSCPNQPHKKGYFFEPAYSQKRRRDSRTSMASFLRGSSVMDSGGIYQLSDGIDLPPVPAPEVATNDDVRGDSLNLGRQPAGGVLQSAPHTACSRLSAFRNVVSDADSDEQYRHRQKRCRTDNKGGTLRKSAKKRSRKWPPPPEIPILPTSDVDK